MVRAGTALDKNDSSEVESKVEIRTHTSLRGYLTAHNPMRTLKI